MAGFQALGLTPVYPSAQPNSHHFHPHNHHHHQPPHHCSSPSPMESVDSLSSSTASQSSKARSFSATGTLPTTDNFHRSVPELQCTATRRRHSEDSSSYMRSEWVTLSKAMLMVLVEKICQLSFENETIQPPATSETESETQQSACNVTYSDDTDDARLTHQAINLQNDRNNAALDSMDYLALETSAAAAAATSTASLARSSLVATHVVSPPSPSPSPPLTSSPPPLPPPHPFPVASSSSSASSSLPSVAASIGMASGSLPSHSTNTSDVDLVCAKSNSITDTTSKEFNAIDSENKRDAVAAAASSASATHTLEHPPPTPPPNDTRKQSSSIKSGTGSCFRNADRKRSSKRIYLKPVRGRRTGKSVESRGPVLEDRMKYFKARPLRQRNSPSSVESWIACNKSLVLSMIDSALGASDVGISQVVDVSRGGVKTAVGFSRNREIISAGGNNVKTTKGGAKDAGATKTICLDKAANGAEEMEEPTHRQTAHTNAACTAPLLGALLSHDDVTISDDKHSSTHHHHQQHHLSRTDRLSYTELLGDCDRMRTISNIKDHLALKWRQTSSTEFLVSSPSHNSRLYNNNNNNNPFQLVDPSAPSVHPHFPPSSTQVFDTTVKESSSQRYEEENSASLDRQKFEDVSSGRTAAAGARSYRPSPAEVRRREKRPCTQRRRPGSDENQPCDLRVHGMDSNKTRSSNPGGRPRWIALNKSEVRSLVDSLVSTMITDDGTKTRDVATSNRLPSNVVSTYNDDTRLVDSNSSRHGNHSDCHSFVDSDSGLKSEGNDGNRRSALLDSGCHGDDVDSRQDRDYGRHGDGTMDSWHESDVQCLSFDETQRPDNDVAGRKMESGSASRSEERNQSSSHRQGGRSRSRGTVAEGSKCTMKWKSTMMLRLHSQSQDGEPAQS